MSPTPENKNIPKFPKSAKAKARYELILDTVESILDTVSLEELGIQEVSKRTGLPSQAIYRIFPSPRALAYGVADRYMGKLREEQAGVEFDADLSWQERLRIGLTQIAEFYNNHPLALQLIQGSMVTSEIRAADRTNVSKMAAALVKDVAGLVIYTDQKAMQLRMEIAVDIADTIWSHSYHLHQQITPFFLQESHRAISAYMESYLGRYVAD